jgi:hypothetical protein
MSIFGSTIGVKWSSKDRHSFISGGIGDYFIFADTFDPLIEQGWQLVPAPEAQAETVLEEKAAGEQEAREEVGQEENHPRRSRRQVVVVAKASNG